jgi:hypothetical protein
VRGTHQGTSYRRGAGCDLRLAVAIEAMWIAVGDGDRFIQRGDVLRGNDPAVRQAPLMFAPASATSAEVTAQREALSAPLISQALEDDRLRREEQARHEPAAIPIERQLRVKQTFRIGLLGRSFGEGELVDREDRNVKPIVLKYPGYFEIPGRPLA